MQLWLDTAYGTTVGNAMNEGIVNLFGGVGTPRGHRQEDGRRGGDALAMTCCRHSARARGLRGPGPCPPQPVAAPGTGRKWTEIVLFTGPALFLFLGFVILPVILAAVYSFFNLPPAFQWDDLNPERFIGFENYVRALTTRSSSTRSATTSSSS